MSSPLIEKAIEKKKKRPTYRAATVKAKNAARAKAVARKLIANPSMPVSTAIRAVGGSEFAATHPSLITKDASFQELIDHYLPQGEILETHRGLLKAASIDHMVFADGPRNENEAAQFMADHNAKATDGTIFTRDDILTDDDIREMLKEKNCEVRRISRTERSRHVYFWSPDSRARKDALDMAYKLRGSYAADKAAVAFSLAALAKLRVDQEDELARLPSRKAQPLIGSVEDE